MVFAVNLIMICNLLSGIISGIWLAILGEWGKIFGGILLVVLSVSAVPIVLRPSALFFAAPASIAMEKDKKLLGIFLGSLSYFYAQVLITTWCIFIFWTYTSMATDKSLIPLLLWSYGIALAPWVWLACMTMNEFSMFTIFLAQVSYALAIVMYFLDVNFGAIMITCGTIMFTGAILAFSIACGGEIKELFSKKEVKEALRILEEASQQFGSGGFNLVKAHVKNSILSNTEQFINTVRKGRTVRKYVYSMIANVSGDMVESGQYHIYRGVLSPTGPGEDLLKVFDSAMDELVRLGDTDTKHAEEEKEATRKNIQNVG